MRAISSALKAHLQSSTTTFCALMKIEPKNQLAPIFGLCTLDRDVIYDDGSGPITYKAKRGYSTFDVQTARDLSVDNSEAQGLLAEYDIDGMTADGIARGLYDSARFVQYLVNYNDLTMGHMVLNSGQVGQVQNIDDMMTQIEMRSLTQILKQQSMIELTSITCRADFGDIRCKQSFQWYDTTVTAVGAEDDRVFTCDGFKQIQNATYFATGDFSHIQFQLKDQGGANVVAGKFNVTAIYDAGNLVSPSNYSVSSSGLVTFAYTPINGHVLAWDGATVISPAGTGAGTIHGVPFFTGDGVATTALLRDTAGIPVTSGFTVTAVYLNGAATTAYSVNSSGLVTFTTAPGSNVACTWDGTIPLTPDGLFSPGAVEWKTGASAGRQSDIESFDGSTNTFSLLIPVYLAVQIGDTLRVRRDCDKTWTMCQAYDNELNFRGEKDLPRADSADLQAPSNNG